jgi:nucleoside-diphosphate-sugar epimerase
MSLSGGVDGLTSVVVTGATGFIGSALTSRLLREGRRVTCLVRKGTPRLPWLLTACRLACLPRAPEVSIVALERFEASAVRAALEHVEPQVIFHLASSGVDPTERDPVALVEGNATLVKTMLAATQGLGLRRFVLTGTCSEYGPAVEPVRIAEGHELAPTSPYGVAKLAAEVEGGALAATLDVPFVPLRLFGTYGPGEAGQRLVPYLVDHLRRGEVPSLTGGEQVRDLMFVEDVVDAILVAATSASIVVGAPYNVCTGEPHRIREVAREVARLMGKPEANLGLGRRPYRADEAMWIVGDPTRLRTATGFRPRVSLEEGLRRAIAHREAAATEVRP